MPGGHLSYVVYGAGAVGGVIAARLALAGLPVTTVARGAHLAAIRSDGLVLESATGRERVRVAAAGSATEVDWSTRPVVLLCVKSQHTAAALADVRASAPADTAVVCAQNGVANEVAALRHFDRAYGMCVMQPCSHVDPGVVVQQCHPVPGILDLGCYPGGVDETCRAIAADLRTAGFVSEARADIMAWKHRKLILNLGNGIQACFRPGPEADELQERVRAEGEAVLAAAGIEVVSHEDDVARRGDLLQGRARTDLYGSTWQSIRRGHDDVESDWLNGEIVLLGRLHGVPTPANDLMRRATNDLARAGGAPRSLDAAPLLDALR